MTALEYFNGDDLAAQVWIDKYSLKDTEGNILESTPDEMHRRIAKEFARIEKKYPNPLSEEEIYEQLKDFKYIIPQGSPMAGIGNKYQIMSLSNCFVIDNSDSDSYGSILKTDEQQVQIAKRRGGVGHDLSHLRPGGAKVSNGAKTSTGLVSFMDRYSNSIREVAQNGRRGALILSCSVRHPDICDFIDAKMEKGKVTGANISVKMHDDFMVAVRKGEEYTLQFPVDNPVITKIIDPKIIWDKIIYNAWKSAEPGILFWDNIINQGVSDCYADVGFKSCSSNPCGELPLPDKDSCRLMVINLYSFVKDPFTKNAEFDFDLFNKKAWIAQRLMDDLIDLETEQIDKIIKKVKSDPEPMSVKRTELELWKDIRKKCVQGRRTGLGITAEGDMIAAMGLKYAGKKGIDFCSEVHKNLAISAYSSSVNMAKERGPFPVYDSKKEIGNLYLNRLFEVSPQLKKDMKKYGRRNIALLTIAPAGSVSLMTQTTSGVECVFNTRYVRRRKVSQESTIKDDVGDFWEEYTVFHPKFAKWLRMNGYDPDVVRTLKDEEYDAIVKKSPYYKATSADVDWLAKVKMQGEIQKWVDHSISVTVNVPEDTTEETIGKIYMTAWEYDCKGITVYRENSRSGVLISAKQDKRSNTKVEDTIAPKRPRDLIANVYHFVNKGEKWLGFIGHFNDRPYELFTGKLESFTLPGSVEKGIIRRIKENGSSRYDFIYVDAYGIEQTSTGLSEAFNPEYHNYAKLISGVLRHGMPLPYVAEIINNLTLVDGGLDLTSWKAGVARIIKRYIKDGTIAANSTCPNCADPDGLVYQEGCLTCKSCGYGKCG